MLTITETAGTVVSNIVTQAGSPETGGLRIGDQGDQFAVSIADAPAAEEIVVEDHGARIFLTTAVADTLDDKVLDAQVGEDGSVRFAIGAPA